MPDRLNETIRRIWEDSQCSLSQLKRILAEDFGIQVSKPTLSRRMKRLNLKPIGKPFGQGMRVFCSDGHIVASYEELRVDEFLMELDIEHRVHYRVQGTPYYIDFWLPEYKAGIEVVGETGNPKYNKRRAEKTTAYREWNIPVIWITPIDTLDSGIIAKLAKAIKQSRWQKGRDFDILAGRNPKEV